MRKRVITAIAGVSVMFALTACGSAQVKYYNADKVGQQQKEDEFDCRFKANQMAHGKGDDVEAKYFDECMKSKGYIAER